ncbi:MAG: thioredoxin family protein [Planctomycetota bacterium]|jgi:thioredoxin-related protein
MQTVSSRWRLALLLLAVFALAPVSTGLLAQETEATEEVSIPWMVDVAKAKAQAKAEKKDLLINFTGSDWCIWCKRLEGEVFKHTPFLDYAGKNFVLLYLDFPNAEEARAKVVDPELNQRLAMEYGVAGYPSIILATHEGNPYGRTGYQPGGPESYVEHLRGIRTMAEPIRNLIANTDASKEAELIEKAFPPLRAQELFGYAGYQKYLTAAKDIPALKDSVAGIEQNAQLTKRMQTPEEPDWAEFTQFLIDSKHLSGMDFLQAVFATVERHLVPEKKYDDALGLLQRAIADPGAQENERAMEFFKGKITEIEALRDGKTPGEGDHDHDHDDHDHDHDHR